VPSRSLYGPVSSSLFYSLRQPRDLIDHENSGSCFRLVSSLLGVYARARRSLP
jgi:hypothetical protein